MKTKLRANNEQVNNDNDEFIIGGDIEIDVLVCIQIDRNYLVKEINHELQINSKLF